MGSFPHNIQKVCIRQQRWSPEGPPLNTSPVEMKLQQNLLFVCDIDVVCLHVMFVCHCHSICFWKCNAMKQTLIGQVVRQGSRVTNGI